VVPKAFYGICAPSTCSREEIQAKLDEGKRSFPALGREEEYYALQSCQIKGDYPDFNAEDGIFIGILALFLALNTCGTFFHMLKFLEPKWILNFSCIANVKRLFDTGNYMSKGQISCLNGMRFWSMVWVLSAHTYSQSYYLRLPVINLVDMSTKVR